MQVVRPLRELEKFGKQYIQFGRWEKSGGSPEHSATANYTSHVIISLHFPSFLRVFGGDRPQLEFPQGDYLGESPKKLFLQMCQKSLREQL